MTGVSAPRRTSPRSRSPRWTVVDRAAALIERNLRVYRRTWYLLVAEVLEPVLYLGSIGLGVGALVGHIPGLTAGVIRYPEFVAPALLATAAMNGAMNETTALMYTRLAVDRTYESILTTPIGIRDIAIGETAWAVMRAVVISSGFLAVIAALGLVASPWVALTIAGAAIIGFAFAAIGLFVVTYIRGWPDFQFIQLFMLPMFLFATTFYPLGVYPRPLQLVVECLPLYQSIELLREPALGQVGWHLVGPAVYLLALGGLALAAAMVRLEAILR
jgi:lipooligosaccharide transport system permease protein